MEILNEEHVKREIAYIFETGANEIRILDLIKRLTVVLNDDIKKILFDSYKEGFNAAVETLKATNEVVQKREI